eukprot:CAMPEP_0197635330 /NCGR_PEP_ID=MMETSP1338-20131121/11175_1 /TAXON_ID=43686 ORGANISM="Pelagodinium beii, Strain RCC1491" /NCGR_SAMPLE_ID=MMETSP1338 /ASSEMBLY_ACC=CAM_ASM_000754 /LENGTH=222 /DNA_ID=CAMNT_0043207357 /DNA_START=74 /DNA_END=742 /DNA_ORIENTATION=+
MDIAHNTQVVTGMAQQCFRQLPGKVVHLLGDSTAEKWAWGGLRWLMGGATLSPLVLHEGMQNIMGENHEVSKVIVSRLCNVAKKNDIIILHEILQKEDTDFVFRMQELHTCSMKKGFALIAVGCNPIWEGTGLHADGGTMQEAMITQRLPRDAINQLKGKPHFFFFDELQYLCDTSRCTRYLPGGTMLAYSDTLHLSTAGVQHVLHHFCPFLRDNQLLPVQC